MFQPGYPSIVSGLGAANISQHSKFSFNLSPSVQDFPKMFLRLQWGTAQLRWDVRIPIYHTLYPAQIITSPWVAY